MSPIVQGSISAGSGMRTSLRVRGDLVEGMLGRQHGLDLICRCTGLFKTELNSYLKSTGRAELPCAAFQPSRHPRAWSLWEYETLTRRWLSGTRVAEIGQEVGRSPSSVYAKRRWLGLPNRPRPGSAGAAPKVPHDKVERPALSTSASRSPGSLSLSARAVLRRSTRTGNDRLLDLIGSGKLDVPSGQRVYTPGEIASLKSPQRSGLVLGVANSPIGLQLRYSACGNIIWRPEGLREVGIRHLARQSYPSMAADFGMNVSTLMTHTSQLMVLENKDRRGEMFEDFCLERALDTIERLDLVEKRCPDSGTYFWTYRRNAILYAPGWRKTKAFEEKMSASLAA